MHILYYWKAVFQCKSTMDRDFDLSELQALYPRFRPEYGLCRPRELKQIRLSRRTSVIKICKVKTQIINLLVMDVYFLFVPISTGTVTVL